MLQFITRRIILLLPVLIGIVFVTFVIVRAIPGDPCKAMLGEKVTKQKCDAFRVRYGLNDNYFVQFGRYLINMAQGDLGTSIRFSRPVSEIVAERLPLTIELTIGAMLFSTTAGILLGVISALRRNSIVDTLTMLIANIGVSMPVFWLGLMLAYLFALVLRGTPFSLPPSGRLTSGMSLISLSQTWGIENPTGLARFGLHLPVKFAGDRHRYHRELGSFMGWSQTPDSAFRGSWNHPHVDYRAYDALQFT